MYPVQEIDSLPPLRRAILLSEEKARRIVVAREREELPKSLAKYVTQAWNIVEPGTPYIKGWHIDAICEHLEALTRREVRNLVITIPPRHTKSLLCSVMWPTWMWTHNPEFKFLCMSYGAHLSLRDALKSRRLIQSPWYQDRWRDTFRLTGDQNAKMRFDNDHMGYRVSSSVGGLGTGEGGDALVVDDPHNLEDINSEVIREGVIEWWDSVMSTRLNNPKTGVRLIIMQRGHWEDLAGHVLKKDGWEHLSIPAEFEMDKRKTSIGWSDPRTKRGELICPERFGHKELEVIKADLGPYGISGQLQQRPTPEEGGIFKREWFTLWPHDVALPQFDFIIQSYDTAYTEKTESDETACTVWGVFKHPKKQYNCAMLLDAWSEPMEYPKLRKRVKEDLQARYGGAGTQADPGRRADVVLVEEKGSGITLLQDLKIIGVPAYSYNPVKADKVVKAHAVAALVFAKRAYLLESGKNKGNWVSWADRFMVQMMSFPKMGEDDFVDTFTQAFLFMRNKEMIEAKVGLFEDEQPEYTLPRTRANPYAM